LKKFEGKISATAFSNVLFLAGGTAAAQAINIIVAPVLSRLYSPSDFGTLALYSAFLGILCGFTGLSYYLAIPLPENENDAKRCVIYAYLCILF